MDYTALKRDASKVYAALSRQADGSVIAIKPAKIYIPERYVEKSLAEIGAEVSIVGIFPIVVDDKYYAVSKINAIMRVKPTTISTVKIDGVTYEEFYFEPGAVVLPTTELVKEDTLVYYIIDYFISNGAVPWFLSYDDVVTLCATSEEHAGLNLTGSHAILGMMAAAIARDPRQRAHYYRHTLDDSADMTQKPIAFVPMRNIVMGPTNTTARLQGSQWADGLNSALANPSTSLERVEQLLRT